MPNSPELAFGSRPSTKPPPYSEFEHVDNQDKKFVLYLANCDTVDTTARKSRTSEISVPVEKLEDGEKPCMKIGCKDVQRRISVAGKRNRDEREDLAYEQQTVEEELYSLEDTANGLEEDCNRCEADANNLENEKNEVLSKLGLAKDRNASLKEEEKLVISKILLAENERTIWKSNVNALAKIISNLMWKGQRMLTATLSQTCHNLTQTLSQTRSTSEAT